MTTLIDVSTCESSSSSQQVNQIGKPQNKILSYFDFLNMEDEKKTILHAQCVEEAIHCFKLGKKEGKKKNETAVSCHSFSSMVHIRNSLGEKAHY